METPAPGGVGLSTFSPEPPRAIPTEALARMLEDVDEACGRTISEVAASSLPFSCNENSRGSVVALVKVSVTVSRTLRDLNEVEPVVLCCSSSVVPGVVLMERVSLCAQ